MDHYERYLALCLKFFSFRPRSKKEIVDYLHKKKASKQIEEKILAFLQEQKFLDDIAFAKWWIEQRTGRKPKGKRLIELELKQKGVSKDTIDKTIYDLGFTIERETENAKRIVEKYLPRYKALSIQEKYGKLGQVLARRGFSYDVIRKSIDEVLKKEV